jgi:hypothetical protein
MDKPLDMCISSKTHVTLTAAFVHVVGVSLCFLPILRQRHLPTRFNLIVASLRLMARLRLANPLIAFFLNTVG